MSPLRPRWPAGRWVAVLIAVVVLVAGAVFVLGTGGPSNTLTAHFTSAVGVYPGSDVRVLGVKVGEILEVEPEGSTVRIRMRYDSSYKVPADAVAVIIAPSVVSDRYVQLAPVYTGGPTMPDGADLPTSRTASPVELDDIYRSLDELNVALGPRGANADGSLSRLLAVGRDNLEGNGEQLNETITSLSEATDALAHGREDLFGTIRNLERFTRALAASDAEVRKFNDRLAQVSAQLAGEKQELAAALRTLAVALGQVASFVRENRDLLVSNVEVLSEVTKVLVRQKQALADVLDFAPTALSNLNLAYNPSSGTLDSRDNMMAPEDLAVFICTAVARLPQQQIPQECFSLVRLLAERGVRIPEPLRALLAELPVSTVPGAYSDEAEPRQPPGGSDERDRTLGGILKGGR